jgi:hypothetical protein
MQWPQVSMFNGELDVGMSAKNELMAGFFFMLDNSYKHVCVFAFKRALQGRSARVHEGPC